MNLLRPVDHAAIRVNQALIIALLLISFVFDLPLFAAAVGVVMLLGTIAGKPGFFPVYRWILRPLGWVRPDVIQDNPEPHRFAQGFGSVVVLVGFAFLLGGAVIAGWALVWLVIILASLNLFVGFCAGCAMYYWLNRLKVPGFNRSAPQGTFPGMRPQAVHAHRSGDSL